MCYRPTAPKVLYGVSYESVEENKSNLDLYVMNTDGSEAQRLTATPGSEKTAPCGSTAASA